jgi:putative transcriptional regulator
MGLCLMQSSWFRRGVLSLVLVFASAALRAAALPEVGTPSAAASLTGQLLIASPEIGDPRFRHAVILLVRHDRDGAIGIIVNMLVGELSLASLMKSVGEDGAGITGTVRIFAGGPVEPWSGFILHSAEYHRDETVDIDGRVAMTSSTKVLHDIGHHAGPRKSLVAFGYTGWGPGQLEAELALHGWFIIPEDPKLVFDDDREKVWDEALARRTFPL